MTEEKGKEIPETALAALTRRNKIEAIKEVRRAWGVDLKAAKDAVDAYILSQPDLRMRFAAAQAQSATILVRWLIVVVLLGLTAYWISTRN